jgi:predicted phosphohydrolase
LPSFGIPDGDILLHAGDATMSGRFDELAEFNRWLGTLLHPLKLFCAGNHDLLFEDAPALGRGILTNATDLQDEMIEVMGLRIYAFPWIYDWAFNLDRDEPLRRKWAMIPDSL